MVIVAGAEVDATVVDLQVATATADHLIANPKSQRIPRKILRTPKKNPKILRKGSLKSPAVPTNSPAMRTQKAPPGGHGLGATGHTAAAHGVATMAHHHLKAPPALHSTYPT